jgi:hypothetical protein
MCSQRTIQTKDGPVVEYYHRGVVCHLIGFEMAVPIDVELQQGGEGEVPAARRLLGRVLSQYARFFDVVSADGLYLEAPFVNACLDAGKHILMTLKGEHRLLFQDAQGLFAAMEPQLWRAPNQLTRVWDAEGFTSCEGIDVPLRVLHAEETKTLRQRMGDHWGQKQEVHDWWWATTTPTRQLPTPQLRQAGHARWDVENDNFNVLVNHWSLNHCFRHEPTAILNFVLTLFIAYVLVQSFFLRNLKPATRDRYTLIGIARELFAGLAQANVRAPWLSPLAGTPP